MKSFFGGVFVCCLLYLFWASRNTSMAQFVDIALEERKKKHDTNEGTKSIETQKKPKNNFLTFSIITDAKRKRPPRPKE